MQKTLKILATLALAMCFMLAFKSPVFAEEYDGYVVKFSYPPVMLLDDENSGLIQSVVPSEGIYKINTNDTEYIDILKSCENVEYIEPDYIISMPNNEELSDISTQSTYDFFVSMASNAGFVPNDFKYSKQWNLDMINTPCIWESDIDTKQIKIGVIDSGNPSRHPDFGDNIEYGSDYTDTGNVYDIYGHSTFVCGVISSLIDNHIGTAGMLKDCSLLPLKIFSDSQNTTTSLLYKAMYDAIYVYDCDVINLSLAFSVDIRSVREIIKTAVDRGIIVVAAAGNSSNSDILYPAGYDGVIGVASVNNKKVRASSSQRNSSVDVSAPGVSVYSTYVTRTLSGENTQLTYSFTSGSGTSYASPHVAGAAAVAKAYDKDMTSDEFLSLLEVTCEHLGDDGKNIDYGYGLLDIQKIVAELENKAQTSNPTNDPSDEYEAASPAPSETPMAYIVDFSPKLVQDSELNIKKVSASITARSNVGTKSVMAVMALYGEKDGEEKLCATSIKTGECTDELSATVFRFDALDIPEDIKNTYVKVFVWDEDFSPMCDEFKYIIKN